MACRASRSASGGFLLSVLNVYFVISSSFESVSFQSYNSFSGWQKEVVDDETKHKFSHPAVNAFVLGLASRALLRARVEEVCAHLEALP